MKTIKQEYHIMAPLEKVWDALVNPKTIDKWGAGPAEMNDKVGTEFRLWGGDLYGKNLKVIKEKKLVQDWTEGDWEKPSKVTFTLTHKDGCTTVYLLQKDVPDKDASDIEDGWNRYYLGQIKKLLED